MREEILKSMIRIVDETMKFNKADFYGYDLCYLARVENNTPFIWSVRDCATTLLMVDTDREIDKLKESEQYRFQFMQNPYVYINNFCQMSQYGGNVIYYDGYKLQSIPINEAPAKARGIFTPMVNRLKEYVNRHFGYDGDYNAKISIHFSPESRKDILRIARTDEGEELIKTLKRFRHHARRSRNHEVKIYSDFANKSFRFHESVNDDWYMCGGIVYRDGHWAIRT